jgi:hypothetical protein
MQLVSVAKSVGRILYAYPDESEGFSLDDWTTHRVLLVEGDAPDEGIYTASLDTDKAFLWRIFEGSPQPVNWAASRGFFYLGDVVALETLLARTAAGVNVVFVSPVSQSGQLKELIIGDDYLAANGRALVWEFDPIAGMDIGDATASLGVRRRSVNVIWTGSVSVGGNGQWVASIEIQNDEWDDITQGLYEYSLEITDGVNVREITRVINELDCKVFLRNKAT